MNKAIRIGFGSVGLAPNRIVFDWTHLSRASANKDFEDLCLDLFGAEYGYEDFTPGPRRTGRDGGFDGYYEGRLAKHHGRWKLACAVRQDPSALRRKIEAERRSAVKAKCTAMVVMTSADLDVPTVRGLSAHARNGLKASLLWPRSKLEHLLRRHPWVAATYFGHQLLPGFVPLATHSDHEFAGQSDLELVGRASECAQIRSFLAGSSRVLVILGSGGSGKSRLLREVRMLSRRERSSWSRRPGIGTIEEGLRSGLPLNRPLLLALDDAGQAPDDVHQLVQAANDQMGGRDIKVVLCARVADRQIVERTLARVPNLSDERLELFPLPMDEVVNVVRGDAPQTSERMARRVARHFGENLFLVRAAARLLNSGKSPGAVLGDNKLRLLVAERLIREARLRLGSLREPTLVDPILLETSLDVPIKRSALSQEQTILLEAGLLRVVGSTVRWRSDVEGDVLLGHLLEEPWGRTAMRALLAREPEKLASRVRNLAAAGTAHASTEIVRTVEQWNALSLSTEPHERKQILEVLPRCLEAAQQAVTALCIEYARTPDSHTTDDFRDIIVALARLGKPIDALTLLRQLLEVGLREGKYANHKPSSMVKDVVSFARTSIEQISVVLEHLSGWLAAQPSHSAIQIIQTVVSSAFATTASWEETEGTTMSLREAPVSPSKPVIELRRKAVDLVKELILKNDTRARLAAAWCLHAHAHSGGGMVPESPGFESVQQDEFTHLAPVIRQWMEAETSVSVMSLVEEGLLFRWAAQRPGEVEARHLLVEVSWPPLLAAFRLCSRRWEFYSSIRELVPAAPSVDRWTWWVHHRANNARSIAVAEVTRLVDAVRSDYPGSQGVASVVEALDDAQRPELFLDLWCSKDPQAFEGALDLNLSPNARERLRRVVQRHLLSTAAFDLLEEFASRLKRGATVDGLQELLDDAPSIATDQVTSIAELLVGAEDLERRLLGLQTIQRRRDVPANRLRGVLAVALRDGVWVRGWDTIERVLDEIGPGLGEHRHLLDLLEARLTDTFESEDWTRTDDWAIKEVLKRFLQTARRRRGRLLAQLVGTPGSWSECVAELAVPLVATPATLKSLLIGFGERIGAGTLHPAVFAQVLGNTAPSLPSSALELARLCLESASPGVQLAGIILLQEMRETRHAEAACGLLVSLAVSKHPLHRDAESATYKFTSPRGAWIGGGPGEPAPALTQIRDLLGKVARAAQSAPERALVANLMQSLQSTIQVFLDADAEFLDPR